MPFCYYCTSTTFLPTALIHLFLTASPSKALKTTFHIGLHDPILSSTVPWNLYARDRNTWTWVDGHLYIYKDFLSVTLSPGGCGILKRNSNFVWTWEGSTCSTSRSYICKKSRGNCLRLRSNDSLLLRP